MPEPREPRSIIDAAEHAAANGDYPSAEQLLREAAALQEATLGPLHPDLANTLNNLGVVCEITGKPADAEDCFRRAVVIATTALEPDHPFVATSRKNLREFCEARGTPVVLPLLPPSVSATPDAQASAADPPRESRPAPEGQAPPPVRRRAIRTLAIGALGPAAMLLVTLTVGRPWLGSAESYEPLSDLLTRSPLEAPEQAGPGDANPSVRQSAPALVEPVPAPQTLATTERMAPRSPSKAGASSLDPASVSRITPASTAARPTVVKARLCAELDEWRCDPPDDPVPAGPLFFYTQIRSSRATTVQHRWYKDGRLHQSVKLHVQGSPSTGYRTYSRTLMNGESAGSWRVELRAEDGVLLHEERFAVAR